jgi:hypothetical protein
MAIELMLCNQNIDYVHWLEASYIQHGSQLCNDFNV